MSERALSSPFAIALILLLLPKPFPFKLHHMQFSELFFLVLCLHLFPHSLYTLIIACHRQCCDALQCFLHTLDEKSLMFERKKLLAKVLSPAEKKYMCSYWFFTEESLLSWKKFRVTTNNSPFQRRKKNAHSLRLPGKINAQDIL